VFNHIVNHLYNTNRDWYYSIFCQRRFLALQIHLASNARSSSGSGLVPDSIGGNNENPINLSHISDNYLFNRGSMWLGAISDADHRSLSYIHPHANTNTDVYFHTQNSDLNESGSRTLQWAWQCEL
jgi:hypothetical protein